MSDTPKRKQLVFSGMQPTNTLHLGNYLGALRNWVKIQNEMPCIFCVVDMHAITQDVGYGHPGELAAATREVAAATSPRAWTPNARRSSTRAACRRTPNWPGSSIAWRGWAGSTA